MQKTKIVTFIAIPAILLIVAASIILTYSPDIGQTGEEGYKDISSLELQSMMKKKDFLLINVHIPYEGEIEGTDMFIPFNEIETNLHKLPEDKSSKIVIYCRSGSMSATASDELVRLGYTNILNLSGGMIDWKAQGFEVIMK